REEVEEDRAERKRHANDRMFDVARDEELASALLSSHADQLLDHVARGRHGRRTPTDVLGSEAQVQVGDHEPALSRPAVGVEGQRRPPRDRPQSRARHRPPGPDRHRATDYDPVPRRRLIAIYIEVIVGL
ncbi:MAG TPA: hypothetical protein VGS18_00715, partial [Thermoplasmata archaeon]|nr:hypothetical protein [Thermoplasmata archaeon]